MSSLFGGGPVEAIISATGAAPHAVLSGVIMMAVMALILFFGLLPKMGRMRTAYLRAERTGQVYSPESRELNLEDEDDEAAPGAHGNILDFVVPIGVLIVLAIAGGGHPSV